MWTFRNIHEYSETFMNIQKIFKKDSNTFANWGTHNEYKSLLYHCQGMPDVWEDSCGGVVGVEGAKVWEE